MGVENCCWQRRRARLYDAVVWEPTLVMAGVIAPAVKDKRGRRRYKADGSR